MTFGVDPLDGSDASACSDAPPVLADTFDADSATWTLRTYAGVVAALDDVALSAGGEPADAARSIRRAVRAAARDSLPPGRLANWRATLEASARSMVSTLPIGTPIELLSAFATPWSRQLALLAANATERDEAKLVELARTIFLDAAHTRADVPSHETTAAAIELASLLSSTSAERSAASGSIDVQSFIALSHTLPHFLAAAWHALFTHPTQLATFRTCDPSSAIDELLRFAGPSRVVFRRAVADTTIGTCQINSGQRVILALADANHDSTRWIDGDTLDLTRDATGHVAFGHGRHSCIGASVVRLAVEVATTALIDPTRDTVRVEHVDYLDGFTIRAPSSLTVTFLS